MPRRRPLAVIGALCAVIALQGAPVASAQFVGPGPRVMITELPELSELPPLPAEGEDPEAEQLESGKDGMTAVQTVALVLAMGVLVAGGTGLVLVTFRGRGPGPVDRPRHGPAPMLGAAPPRDVPRRGPTLPRDAR